MKQPIIQSLWIGASLSNIEKLCIRSFIDHGHEFHLYTYDDVGDIPEGVVVKDANEMLPASKIFRYKDGSYAGFGNWFRYELLYKSGGAWVDMDMVCLRPLVFADNKLVLAGFCLESTSRVLCSTPLIITSKGHPLMLAMAKFCRDIKKKEGSEYGSVGGPGVLHTMTHKMNYSDAIQPPHYFLPFNEQTQWMLPFTNYYGGSTNSFSQETYAFHLSNDILRQAGLPKNATFDSASLFEFLKKRHNIPQTTDAQIFSNADVNTIVERLLNLKHKNLERKNLKRRILEIIGLSSLIGLVICLSW